MFSIDKVTSEDGDCVVVVLAKTAIKHVMFDWTFVDKDGAHVGHRLEVLKDLAKGDRARVTFSPPKGATRVVTIPHD